MFDYGYIITNSMNETQYTRFDVHTTLKMYVKNLILVKIIKDLGIQ